MIWVLTKRLQKHIYKLAKVYLFLPTQKHYENNLSNKLELNNKHGIKSDDNNSIVYKSIVKSHKKMYLWAVINSLLSK